MRTFLHKKFIFNLHKVKNQDRILVAISGGKDSVCLIKLIDDCLHKKWNIEALYIDYQWKKDSFKHTKHIIYLMKQLSIPISIYQIQEKCYSETNARQLRYQLLIKHADIYNYNIIITGHNNNDKIETFIQNIIRGSSINGITHIRTFKNITKRISLVRPLINFTQAEIIWLCREFLLPIWSDVTNWNYNTSRNRIRYELMPYLNNYFNPNIQQTINRFTELCRQDNEYINENTVKLYIKSRDLQWVSLNLKIIRKQHVTLQKRVLQLYFYCHFYQRVPLTLILRILKDTSTKIKLTINNLNIKNINGWLYVYYK